MFGIDDAIGAALNIGGKIIDRVIPDPAAAAAAKLELIKLQQSGELAQMGAVKDLAIAQAQTNTAEAASTNTFVSGWRPMVGWTCALGLGTQFIVRPFFIFGANLLHKVADFPVLDLGTLTTLLFGMLGLGAMRTLEKVQGVAAK